jgi:singapore isolate B (sub-type 7) whole genome shotgun sequence assembly, scaffold_7
MMHEGFEVYSGTMIGLPFQTDENLVEDILLMKELHVDGLE